jgi:hypothetical protein
MPSIQAQTYDGGGDEGQGAVLKGQIAVGPVDAE